MSKLFDDASLVMIPSAYKDGKLYSIRPVPEYGAEEITNGGFDTDSDWTKETGWTISGGKASYNGSAATNALYQNIAATSGTTYRVKFSVVNYVSGSFKAFISNGSATGSSPLITANGDYVFDITATGILLVFRNVTSFNGSIDNVSVQEIVSSGDFTFSRGSNLAATRVDVNGLIEKGRENLLLQSNQFDTTWTTPDATITGGQADKDGGTDAWLLTATSAFNRLAQSVSQSGVKRFSVYAKANTNDYLLLGSFEGAHFYATFNLATGAVDSNNINAISPSIEDVGNGWYRCSATWTGTTTEVRIASQATSGQGGWASTTSGSIYIQDAQLEQGLVATDYIETGASTAQAGILEDMPRLDYSGGASCPSLLLEPQRQNSVASSEYVVRNVFGWDINGDGGITTENNSATSPEGLQNAVKLIYGGSGYSYARQSLTSGAGTISIYVKKGNWRYIGLRNGENQSTHSVFDFDTESFVLEKSGHTLGYESVGNGWYRIWDYQPTSVSPANGLRGVAMCDANGAENSPETPAGSYNYIWGFQAEIGASYPTSYIPTYGTSQTRSVEQLYTLEDSSLFDLEQGTFFLEMSALEDDNTDRKISISDGTNDNMVDIGFSRFTGNINGEVISNGVLQTSGFAATGVTQTNNNKFALVWGNGEFRFYLNGVKTSESSISNSPVGMDILRFAQGNGSQRTFLNNKQLLVFPTALTDSECIALTTL